MSRLNEIKKLSFRVYKDSDINNMGLVVLRTDIEKVLGEIDKNVKHIISDLEYSAYNLCEGRNYKELPIGLVESTSAQDTLLMAIRDLRKQFEVKE